MFRKYIRRLRGYFGLLAPRLEIRRHVSWWWRALLLGGLSFLLFFFGWLLAKHDSAADGERVLLCERRILDREELDSLRAEAGAGKSAVNIERAVQQQLLSRVKELESESALLREDILVLERLLTLADESGVLKVENFRVMADESERYRYRMLLIFNSDKQHPEFQGSMKLLLSYVRNGEREQFSLLEKNVEAGLRFKNLTRRSGVFDVPPGVTQLELEVQVLQGDTVKIKRIARL